MLLIGSALALVFASALAIGIHYFPGRCRRGLLLPPGPRQHIVQGSAHEIPPSEPWKRYSELAKRYGPLTYLRVHTTKIIIINTANAVTDLLQKRAEIYSTRPQPYMLTKLMGCEYSVFNITSEHESFRTFRRMLGRELAPRMINIVYAKVLEDEQPRFLRKLYEKPDNFIRLVQLNAAAVVMMLTYGYPVDYENDMFMKVIEDVAQANREASQLWLCDYYPLLRLLPSWFPGGGYKRKGQAFKSELDKLIDIPFDWVKEQMANDRFIPSFTSRTLLAELDNSDKTAIKCVAAGLYAGGQDTIAAVITAFILLMCLHPAVQRKAQEELDNLLGGSRLPTMQDFTGKSVPYLYAIMKETLRWAPPVPLAVAHMARSDDTYAGRRIPQGCTMVPNIWGIMHEEENFSDPTSFDPERFLESFPSDKARLDPLNYVFGFGGRACPGIYFAQKFLLFTMASILTVFRIKKSVDAGGLEMEPQITFDSGVVSHLQPFDCCLEIRDGAEILLD